METGIKTKVKQDINEGLFEGECIDFCNITSTDGSRDCITAQRLQTGEPIERLLKNVFTGIDFVASPEHHNALMLFKANQPGSGNILLIDKKWRVPVVFSRPNKLVAR